MKEVDIGDPSPAVYMRIEYEIAGRPVAAFASLYGEAFCLERAEVEFRIRYLESQGSDTMEERKALKALAAAGG